MKKIGIVFIFILMGCSSIPNSDTSEKSQDYKSIVDSWTKKDQLYSNFSAAFQVTAVFLSRELVEAQIKLDAQRFNWSQEETEKNRQKALYDLQTQATFLLSLYTDKDEDNNLEKAKPAWNLFLDVNGRRITPQSVARVYENRVALLQKYPAVGAWSRNYYVKFAIPTDDATTGNTTLSLAGPLGSSSLKFK